MYNKTIKNVLLGLLSWCYSHRVSYRHAIPTRPNYSTETTQQYGNSNYIHDVTVNVT